YGRQEARRGRKRKRGKSLTGNLQPATGNRRLDACASGRRLPRRIGNPGAEQGPRGNLAEDRRLGRGEFDDVAELSREIPGAHEEAALRAVDRVHDDGFVETVAAQQVIRVLHARPVLVDEQSV